MRRDQLEHAIRAACQIAGLTEVIIVGSQAILGTYTEDSTSKIEKFAYAPTTRQMCGQ
jgi:hypothetical protein